MTPYAGSLLCRPGRQDAGRVFYCTISELDLLRDSSLAFLEDLPPLFLLGHNLGNRLLANLQISSNLFLRFATLNAIDDHGIQPWRNLHAAIKWNTTIVNIYIGCDTRFLCFYFAIVEPIVHENTRDPQQSRNLFLRPPLLRLQLEGDLSLHSLQFAFLLRRQVASGHVATNDEGLLLRFEFSLR